jgi:transcriptional regulator with XRE-family HTH domain
MPRIDTVQKIAAAFEVSTSYLLGEEDVEIDLRTALARQSLKIYLRDHEVSQEFERIFARIVSEESAPQTCEGWDQLRKNLAVIRSMPSESTRM